MHNMVSQFADLRHTSKTGDVGRGRFPQPRGNGYKPSPRCSLCGGNHLPKLTCLRAWLHRAAKKMKPARKHRPNWDSGFFMERTDPERVKASRREGGKLPRFKRRPFDIQAALRAWKEIGYTNDAAHIREHLGILWEKRKVKR